MRIVILLIIAALAALFLVPFAGGLGYAAGGGEATVRILTDEVVASSGSGQAVAVGWSDIEHFNASNTPQRQPEPVRSAPVDKLVMGVMLLAFVAGGFILFTKGAPT